MTEKRSTISQRKITEWVSAGPYAVAVEVDAQFLADQDDLPLLTPQTVRHLEKVAQDARNGNLAALKEAGRVYVELNDELATSSS